MAKTQPLKIRRRAATDVSEARVFRETLEANRQIAHKPGPLPSGATHQVETDAKGRKQLKRKRFSAV